MFIANKYFNQPFLIIDDEYEIVSHFKAIIETQYKNKIYTCSSSKDALPLLKQEQFSLIFLDLNMPEISGYELLPKIVALYPDLPVIVITGNDDISSAVTCIKEGAFDYIVKPVDINDLFKSIQHAEEIYSLKKENELLRIPYFTDELTRPEVFSKIITQNAEMLSVFSYLEVVSKTHHHVLITGETGTGKELFAQAVHNLSSRSGKFIAVNVSGIDETVFADTLFGHLKGAYTGADRNRNGLIEEANGGTLFLDEIGDLSQTLQVQLLRFLQEKEYYQLGSDSPKTADVRIVAATNRAVSDMLKDKYFRNDLLFRLKMYHVHIPALRDRLDDIPLLLKHFIDCAASDLEISPPSFNDKLVLLLQNYNYPGNIRELESLVYQGLSFNMSEKLSISIFKDLISKSGDEEISSDDHHSIQTYFESIPVLPKIEVIETVLIQEAMRRTDNNQKMSSEIIGISRQTIIRKLKKIDI